MQTATCYMLLAVNEKADGMGCHATLLLFWVALRDSFINDETSASRNRVLIEH